MNCASPFTVTNKICALVLFRKYFMKKPHLTPINHFQMDVKRHTQAKNIPENTSLNCLFYKL